MKTCAFSAAREQIIAEAISPVATELRLVDAADLISMLRFECYGSLADLVSSAAEMFFHPGTINFGAGGDYALEWNGRPEVTLDLEIKPKGLTVYARLLLKDKEAGIEINHIAFQEPSEDPNVNTAFLKKSLEDARYTRPVAEAA
ncbi:hypothetical protein [Gellertiella hungarica]|uniref:Uncharacterized protein n=1 Tax=Gellertiella hungarica TaxID=1572859 RepID=A0A7W6NK21_9HYPH|nr:hypothetical protein [Gellertiella hungarica]MBB4064104.1 hypothetical protein [Gellertiella hungarica]